MRVGSPPGCGPFAPASAHSGDGQGGEGGQDTAVGFQAVYAGISAGGAVPVGVRVLQSLQNSQVQFVPHLFRSQAQSGCRERRGVLYSARTKGLMSYMN